MVFFDQLFLSQQLVRELTTKLFPCPSAMTARISTGLIALVSNHLLVILTVGFTAGIALGPGFHLSQTTQTLLLYSLGSATLLLLIFHIFSFRKTVLLLLPLLFIALGVLYISWSMHLPADPGHLYNRINKKTEVVLIGTMSSMATFDGRMSRTIIRAEALRKKDAANFLKTSGRLRLTMQGKWPEKYRPGDRLVIRATLKRPASYASPGSFDYARYLAQKDIWVTGYIQSQVLIERLPNPPGILHKLRYLHQRIRTDLGKTIDRNQSQDHRGLYRALLLGDRTAVPEKLLEQFKACGVLHILAVSGLHMTIVGTLVYFIIYLLLSRSETMLLRYPVPKIAASLCLPVLAGYALLSGMNSPVFRAAIMASVVIVAICTNRKKSAAPLISSAALILLMLDPLQIFTASFLLSFAAIIGILLVLPVLKKIVMAETIVTEKASWATLLWRWVMAGILVSLVATVITAPISIATFNRISIIGPVANLLVEPLLCLWTLPLGIAATISSFASEPLAQVLLAAGSYGIDLATTVTSSLSRWSFSSLWLPTPPNWLIILFYSALVVSAWCLYRQSRSAVAAALLFLFCIPLLFWPAPYQRNKNHNISSVTFLDVGQGTATLIQFSSGEKVLIDGGGSSMSDVSVGQRVIAPYLWSRGINSLDALFITHPDADHYNGLAFIVEHFQPKTLWLRKSGESDQKFMDFLQLVSKSATAIKVAVQGQRFTFGKNSVECLYNFAQPRSSTLSGQETDNSGLVLRLCVQQQCLLFPGDIAADAERTLVRESIDIQSNMLLAAHHGSKTSNSLEFLSAVKPEKIIVSAGKNRQSHFPSRDLLNISRQWGIEVLNTATEGTIEVRLDNTGRTIYHYIRYNNNPLYPFEKVEWQQ
jgi:competence protein ComEC